MANESAVPGSAVPGSTSPGAPTSSSASSWPDVYTYNFCPNPSAEASITGYVPLHPGSSSPENVFQADSGYSGQASVGVTTPGDVPGEGVATPLGTPLADATGAMSLWVYGETGMITVTAVNSAGAILASIPATLNGTWQRVILNNVTMTSGTDVQLLAMTTVTQSITFFVDAVQYEPESPANPYIDGDQPNCVWTGAPEFSASYQQYQFPISSNGMMLLEGSISIVAQGETFTIGNSDPASGPVVLISGMMDISGVDHQMVATTEPGRTVIPPAIDTGVSGLPWLIAGFGTWSELIVVSPSSGLSAFAVWETGVDVDPALSLIGQNNAGTKSGQTSYNQVYGMFTPPVTTLDSAGQAIWQGATYMAAGFKVSSLAPYASGTPNAVNFTNVQVEPMPVSSTPTPSAYQLPRSLNTIVKPTRMNYVTNPSFEVSDAGWTESGSATFALSDDVPPDIPNTTQSLQVTSGSNSDGAYISVGDLIAGDVYTASAYVAAYSDNLEDIFMNIGSLSTDATSTGSPLYGGDATYPGYGEGPYGGVISSSTPMASLSWYRMSLSFTAPASTIQVSFAPVLITGGSGSMVWNLDCIMVEPGEVLNPYSDGDSDGWEWELGGTAGLARSYYYERQQVAAQAVQQVLSQHTPLGITAYEPQFAVPATQ